MVDWCTCVDAMPEMSEMMPNERLSDEEADILEKSVIEL